MDNAEILNNIVRVGTVRAVDAEKRMAQVWYGDLGIVSGWLHVVQFFCAGVDVAPDGGHSHSGEVPGEPAHAHCGTAVAGGMPAVDARVLVLYMPVFNGDGFILGGL